MTEHDETKGERIDVDPASSPWNILTMAMLAPLGSFSTVRLTPRLTRDDLGIAADFVLPRAPGEFLAGVIQRPSPVGVPPILLTNHRMVWFERLPSASDRPSFTAYATAYQDVSTDVAATTESGVPAVDLGGGRIVTLSTREPGLAAALAESLGVLSRAARTGEGPPIDADLSRRIVAMIPSAVKVDASLRVQGEHRSQFREDLFRAVPNAFVTRFFIMLCVLVFAAMLAKGVDPLNPSPADLLDWGANNDVLVARDGEWWRLAASIFLHVGVIHLAFNMWALAGLGPLVERLYGNLRYATIFLAAGVGGSAASMATLPINASAGASGAIFGVLGALLAFLLVRRHAVPATVLKPLRTQAISFAVFTIALGAVVAVIDQSAHLGGLAVGFLAGLFLAPEWPRKKPSSRDTARSAALSAVVALVVLAVTAAAIHWRAGTFPPAAKRAAALPSTERS